MTRTSVQRIYSLLGARWYDPFRHLWVFLTTTRPERDMDRLFLRYVTPDATILDLGCGTGVNLARLRRLGIAFRSYTGVDFTEEMLAIARNKFGRLPGVTFVRGDVTALEDRAERYDAIVSTYLLSHLRKPADVVNGIQGLLAPEGHLLLIFFSRPRWFLDFWMSPLSRLVLRADPVRPVDVARFRNIGARRIYFAGAITLADIHTQPEPIR